MRKSVLMAMSLLFLTSSLLVAVCPAQVESTEIIRLKGANSMVNMCDRIGREFTKSSGVRVIVAGGGTAAGFDAYCDKACDIVMASRKMNSKENQQVSVCGAKVQEVLVSHEPVAIVVNRANPVRELTFDQVSRLLSGEYQKWTQVGGADNPVVVVTSEGHTGTTTFVREQILGESFFSSDAVVKNLYFEILKEIDRKPGAIGYAGLTDAQFGVGKGLVKIVALKKDEQSPALIPSLQTVEEKDYPLLQPLYFYWPGDSARKSLKSFVTFFLERVGKR
ncbi:MAG: PstS family phosphate ABC transporter substrate-binding protein [Thermodesulfobacteriota bacterium]